MMKRIYFLFIVLIFAFGPAACNRSENNINGDDSNIEERLADGVVKFSLPDFCTDSDGASGEVATKTVYSKEKGKLVWSDKDTIGVFPETGSPIYFSMADGAGDDVAVFDGGGWRLKPGTTYYTYAPFYPSVYLKAEAIPYTTAGQFQQSNGVRNHDGFDCLWARKKTASNNAINFDFTRLCCFLKFILTPDEGTYTELELSTKDNIIPVKGTFNIKAEEPALSVPEDGYASSLSMGLGNMKINPGEELVVYMAFIPCDLTGKKFSITLKNSEGGICLFDKTFTKAFEASVLYNVVPEVNYFLSQSAYGIYDLVENKPICTYVAGKDSYSVLTKSKRQYFRIMNPSADDADYKFLQLGLNIDDNGLFGFDLIDVYAPSLPDSNGIFFDLYFLRSDGTGRVWLTANDKKLGFIVNLKQ